jgi:hypothetical protein
MTTTPSEPTEGSKATAPAADSEPEPGRQDSTSTSNLADPDDDQDSARTDFADEGYDDRQLDGTRDAAEDRGDLGPATTPGT